MAGTEPVEHHIAVLRTARFWSLGADAERAHQLWIVCHGFGQLAERFVRRFEAIATPERRIVAPEALNRFYLDGRIGPHGPDAAVGATWMTREDRLREIDDYIAYLDTLHEHLTPPAACRVVALGFSQGTATVARWAARTDRRIDDLVLWAGGLPPELEPAPDLFGRARLTLVNGDHDRMVTPAAMGALAERLAAAGRSCARVTHPAGHEITPAGLHALVAAV